MFSIDPNDPETRKDLAALDAYRKGRLAFNLRVAEESLAADPQLLVMLQSDATYQLAEFLYLLAAFGINTVDEFDGLIERHNVYVTDLISHKEKSRRMGLSKERLLSSIFDGDVRPRVLEIWRREPGTLDQSSLARFLVAVMSDETARKTVLACEQAGLMSRQQSVFRAVLVRSTGKLEAIYAECLRMMRSAVTQPGA
ncbi:MAG: hypothetical protein WDN31_18095 [Hyphomicrobium sp.]